MNTSKVTLSTVGIATIILGYLEEHSATGCNNEKMTEVVAYLDENWDEIQALALIDEMFMDSVGKVLGSNTTVKAEAEADCDDENDDDWEDGDDDDDWEDDDNNAVTDEQISAMSRDIAKSIAGAIGRLFE